jgi:hypothetical protein
MLDPLGMVKAAKITAGSNPRTGEQWKRDYTYGAISGATEPKLISDVLTNTGARGGVLGRILDVGGRSAFDQGLDQIRQMLSGK